jgi:hypothetical protein
MSVDEFFKIDSWVDSRKHEKTVREIILRLIREHAELIRMRTEGKI